MPLHQRRNVIYGVLSRPRSSRGAFVLRLRTLNQRRARDLAVELARHAQVVVWRYRDGAQADTVYHNIPGLAPVTWQ